MQVLVLAAPRNGIGRTTLAYRLARQALRAEAGPVVLLDADPRGDLSRQCAEQPRQDIIAAPWDESCNGPEFRRLTATKPGLIIVDAALPEQTKAFEQALSIADLVAVLVRPREDDVALLPDAVELIKAADKPYFFVLNRAKRHGNMAAATAIALARHGAVCPIILPEDEPVTPSLRAKVFRKKTGSGDQTKRDQFWAYISGRLGALRGEAVPAGAAERSDVREGSDAPETQAAAAQEKVSKEILERRAFPRYSYDIGATFSWNRRVYPCQIQNISAGGLAMSADLSVPLGTRLKLHIPYLGEFDAICVHRNETSAGLQFVIDEWQQAGLVRDLTGLLAAGPGAAKRSGGASKSRQAREGRVGHAGRAGPGGAEAGERAERGGRDDADPEPRSTARKRARG